MAKQKKQKKAAKKGNNPQNVTALLGIVTLGLAAIFFMPTAVLLAIGMMPTIVALISDNSRERLAGVTVGMLNLAGLAPFLMDLWLHKHTMNYAMDILMDMQSLVIIYLAAGLGWILYIQLPLITAKMALKRSKVLLKKAQKEMEELEGEWGEAL